VADTNVATGLTVQQWDDQFFTEYLTENRFSGEFGSDEASIIQVKEDLTKKKGDRVTFALVNKLTNDATTGSSTLEGNEESMDSRSHYVTVDKRRNAVRVSEIDEQYSAISLRDAGRAVLKDWSMKDTETLVIKALGKMGGIDMNATDTAASGNQTTLDAWLSNNSDRVFFGNNAYAATSGDLSAGLATLTAGTAAENLTASNLSKMKFFASVKANPKIRPVRSPGNGKLYYVAYAHPLAFRDLKADSTITQAQREVMLEMENNRLFQGGDLLWDGIIVKEIQEMFNVNTLTNLGDSGTSTVVPVFLCGAQAIGAAYARRWRSREQTFDYGDKQGVAIDSIYGIEKMTFGSGSGDTDNPKDHGVVTGFFSASSAT
jgi:N4-gp56 family major capsid protein